MTDYENFAFFPLFPLSPLFLSQYLLDATDAIVEQCNEKYVIDEDIFHALCFLVVSFRTCELDEAGANDCLKLMGVSPATFSAAMVQLADYYCLTLPNQLLDQIAFLNPLLPDSPPFGGQD
jgi:hypothetical protein